MEEKKKNLKNIYDVINKIARKRESEGKNIDDWFYSKKELIHIKNNNAKIFLN